MRFFPKKITGYDWKGLTIILAILTSLVLFFASCMYFRNTEKWLISIVFPMIISLLMGICVSMWFTIKTEKENFDLELERELDALFNNTSNILSKMTLIVSFPFINNLEKKRQLFTIVSDTSNTYFIEIKYPELFNEYKKICEKNKKQILSMEPSSQNFVENFFKDKFSEIALEYREFEEKLSKIRNEVFLNRRKNIS